MATGGSAPRALGLVLEHLRVAYGSRVVLEDVALCSPRGAIVGLLGPNGAGKSTLLKAALGLVPRLGGAVTLDGVPLADRASRARVAYVPQRSDVDWSFPITVDEVVLLGRQGRLGLLGRPGPADRAAAHEALERLEMASHRRAQIGELSGGQQQRVFLARALAQAGDALLLDEPLTGVDATTQELVLGLLRDLRRAGQVILVSTHDLPLAADLCDRVCLLNRRIVAAGPPDEVLTPAALAATYGAGGLLRLRGGDAVVASAPASHVVPVPHGAGGVCDEAPPWAPLRRPAQR